MSWQRLSPPSFWRRWLPEGAHRPALVVFYGSIAGLLILAAFAVLYLDEARRFNLDEVARLPAGTLFYDRAGKELPAAPSASRRLVKREDIPDFLVKAILAREDARFYEHGGIDVRGLARASFRNLKDGSFTQGASTLTMQLTRNTFGMRAKSLHRKFLEIVLTRRVEALYSKDEILTHYLNRIYFGSGAHGIEQAARIYFGKATRELAPGECALLAGIIRGPHLFSPIRNLPGAIEQRNQTLARMQTLEFIDETTRLRMAKQRVRIVTEEARDSPPSYALQSAQRVLKTILEEADIRLDGLKVYTTLDAAWQDRLEEELVRAVMALEKEDAWPHVKRAAHPAGSEPAYLQFAAVTTEIRTGATLALIGGRDFAHSRYDRTRSMRDLGAVFEPFVAAAAAEKGVPVVAGQPVTTGRQVGAAEVERIARRCGITGPRAETDDLFRGTIAATQQEMAVALATLGGGGRRPAPYLIREVRGPGNELLYKMKAHREPAIAVKAAEAAINVLAPIAGTRCVTGATASERDAWVLRLGPGGATAVWLGFDKPVPIAPEARLKALLEEVAARLGNEARPAAGTLKHEVAGPQ